MKGLRRIQQFEDVHSPQVTCAALGQKSGRVLVTGGTDSCVKIWAVGKSAPLLTLLHPGPVECASFNLSEEIVAIGGTSSFKLWDLARPSSPLRTVESDELLAGLGSTLFPRLRCVQFHPYGNFFAAGVGTHVKLWDSRQKGCIQTYEGHPLIPVENASSHQEKLNVIRFSPDGRWLVSAGGNDSLIKVWDLTAGKMLKSLSTPSPVSAAAFHREEVMLATGDERGKIQLWDLESWEPVRLVADHNRTGRVCGFGFGATSMVSLHDGGKLRTLKVRKRGTEESEEKEEVEVEVVPAQWRWADVSIMGEDKIIMCCLNTTLTESSFSLGEKKKEKKKNEQLQVWLAQPSVLQACQKAVLKEPVQPLQAPVRQEPQKVPGILEAPAGQKMESDEDGGGEEDDYDGKQVCTNASRAMPVKGPASGEESGRRGDVSDDALIDAMLQGHSEIQATLASRLSKMKGLRTTWLKGNYTTALESMLRELR